MAKKDLRELYGADLLAEALRLRQANEGLVKALQKKQAAVLELEARIREVVGAIKFREAEEAGRSGFLNGVPPDQNPFSLDGARDWHIAWRVAWFEARKIHYNELDVEALTQALFTVAEETMFEDWETTAFAAATQYGVSDLWVHDHWNNPKEPEEEPTPPAKQKKKEGPAVTIIDTKPSGGNGSAVKAP